VDEVLEIVVGATYRGKYPRKLFHLLSTEDVYNDRTVVWMSPNGARLCYDGPGVRVGKRRPITSTEQFRAWAERRVYGE